MWGNKTVFLSTCLSFLCTTVVEERCSVSRLSPYAVDLGVRLDARQGYR
jgi:hypothetical protein